MNAPPAATMTPATLVFSAAPHRMMFFAGALQLLVPMLFWTLELGARQGLWMAVPTALPATWLHALLMLFVVFPFFMFGFLMTTYPRWMNGAALARSAYTPPFMLMFAGALLLDAGVYVGEPMLVAGLVLHLLGWGLGLRALYGVYRRAPATDKRYESYLNIAFAAGWLGAFCFLLFLLGAGQFWYRAAIEIAVWLYLLPMLVIVAHRMLPFFSSSVWSDYVLVQPRWSLPLVLIAGALHVLLALLNLPQWLFVAELPLLTMAVHHSAHWGLRRSFEVRLLAILHMAFVWLSIAMALYSLQSLSLWFGDVPLLGRAPLHALTIGFVTSMTIAMVTRVTMGHSGRALECDAYTYAIFLGISGVAVLRILAELPALAQLMLAVALFWLLVMALWLLRYLPMYLRRRVDGKPG